MDLCKAYYQIPLAKESKKLTAFATERGLLQFTRLPFGLLTAGSNYNRMMRRIIAGLSDVSFYFDNVYVATRTWESHLHALRSLLEKLKEQGLTAGPTKCYFAYESIDYLGFKIGQKHLTTQQEKVDAIVKMPRPKTKKQLRSFMGAASFYRRFVPHFASIAAPLNDLLKKTASDPVTWNPHAITQLEILKGKLVTAPILRLPNPNKIFGLRTDASRDGLGGVLLQYEDDETAYPIAYVSRKLLSREKAYATIEIEALAIIWSIGKFKYYLIGREFKLECDHKPLSYLGKNKCKNGRLLRWSLLLMEYQYSIHYIKGSNNCMADSLSRNPVDD